MRIEAIPERGSERDRLIGEVQRLTPERRLGATVDRLEE
jgi:hypothetical protein